MKLRNLFLSCCVFALFACGNASSVSSIENSSVISTKTTTIASTSETEQDDYTFHFTYTSKYYGTEDYEEGKVIEDNDTYTTTIHWMTCNENHIYGRYSLPKNRVEGEKLPTVILLHGYNSNYQEWLPFVPYLTASGYAVMNFDCRGCHTSNCHSDGKFIQMTLDTEIADVMAVREDVSTLSEVDNNNCFLMGHSQGGLLSALSISRDDLKDRFNGLISLSGAFSLIDNITSKYEEDNLPDSAIQLYAKVGKNYLKSCFRHKNYKEELKNYTGPALLACGALDNVVSPEDVKQTYQDVYSQSEQNSYVEVPDTYHDFTDTTLQNFYPDYLEPFIKKNIKA